MLHQQAGLQLNLCFNIRMFDVLFVPDMVALSCVSPLSTLEQQQSAVPVFLAGCRCAVESLAVFGCGTGRLFCLSFSTSWLV